MEAVAKFRLTQRLTQLSTTNSKSMTLQDLTIDNTRSYMVDVHGKKYPIKQQRGRYYIQHATGQLTVTAAVKSADFEPGSRADYVFNGWFEIYDETTFNQFAKAELAWLNM